MPYLFFAVICLVWGASFILMKKAAVCFSPVAVGAWRVIGGAAVLAIIWWFRSRRLPFQRRDAGVFAAVVFLGFAWPYSLQPLLVARHGSAFVGMTVSFTPLLTILASVPLLGIYPTPRQAGGVIGALVCLTMLMAEGWRQEIPAVDLAAAVSVPLGYAVTNTLIRRSLAHIPALEMTLACLVTAGVVLLPLSYFLPQPAAASTGDWRVAVASLIVLGVVGTGLAMFLFNKLIREQGPLFAGMVTNLVPLGAVVWGWLDNEKVTLTQLGALIGLLAMVTVVQYGAVRLPVAESQNPRHDPA